MIYFNVDGALGAPKAIFADGNLTTITTDIAMAVVQVYHNFPDPITKELFKLGIAKVFAADSFIWAKDSKMDAEYIQAIRYNADELKRQKEALERDDSKEAAK